MRVSWEWPDGSGSYEDFSGVREAENAAFNLPDECRVWIGDDVVRQGWVSTDDQQRMF